MKTEYVIGQVVNLPWRVTSITVTEDGTRYKLSSDVTEITLSLKESQIIDIECISADDYEAEIADLKDEINRLREMYQLEHMKVLKAKFKAPTGITGDSHHPQENTYSDEWRKMP